MISPAQRDLMRRWAVGRVILGDTILGNSWVHHGMLRVRIAVNGDPSHQRIVLVGVDGIYHVGRP